MVIPVVAKDLGTLPLCIEGVRRQVQHPIENIYLVAPDDERVKQFCREQGLVYVEETTVLGFGPKALNLGNRSGWLFQQFIKLSGGVGTCRHYLCIDADHVLIRPHVFLSAAGETVFYMSYECHQPYYDNILRLIPELKLADLSYVAHKMLFSKASRKKPCIIFIDEFDSIGERRNYAGTGIDKENNRIITTMLNEMDGFVPNNGLMVIAATNSYASLDPALIRPGRFDLKYTITNPDAPTRARLIEIYSNGKNMDHSLDIQTLVVAFDGLSCAAIETILNEAQAICQQQGGTITMNHILAAAQKTGSKLNIRIHR